MGPWKFLNRKVPKFDHRVTYYPFLIWDLVLIENGSVPYWSSDLLSSISTIGAYSPPYPGEPFLSKWYTNASDKPHISPRRHTCRYTYVQYVWNAQLIHYINKQGLKIISANKVTLHANPTHLYTEKAPPSAESSRRGHYWRRPRHCSEQIFHDPYLEHALHKRQKGKYPMLHNPRYFRVRPIKLETPAQYASTSPPLLSNNRKISGSFTVSSDPTLPKNPNFNYYESGTPLLPSNRLLY